MHDFRKRLLSTCALLLMASVAFAANTGLLEQRADKLLAESEELAAAVMACPDGDCERAVKLVGQLKETSASLEQLRSDIDESKVIDAGLLRADAKTDDAQEIVCEAKTIVRFWEETW